MRCQWQPVKFQVRGGAKCRKCSSSCSNRGIAPVKLLVFQRPALQHWLHSSSMQQQSFYANQSSLGMSFYQSANYISCDIFPSKPAVVHCEWSGGNFSEEAAEILRGTRGSKYFSAGESAPRPRVVPGTSAPVAASQGDVGIGVVLEIDARNKIIVKSFVKDGPAARSGLLQEGDAILMVNGIPTHELGREVPRCVIGPSGTPVELIVERGGVLVPPVTIIRGAVHVIRTGSTASAVPSEPPQKPSQVQDYNEKPFYLSMEDRDAAIQEVASRTKALRSKLGLPETPINLTAMPHDAFGPAVLL